MTRGTSKKGKSRRSKKSIGGMSWKRDAEGKFALWEPTADQRALVKMLVGAAKCDIDEVRQVILRPSFIDPALKVPVSRRTMYRKFKREIMTARTEIKSIIATKMMQRVQAGSDTMIIWSSKQLMGFRDDPDPPKIDAKLDAAGADVKHEVEIVGGLPKGSTPEKPEGDDYSEIPPEESHG